MRRAPLILGGGPAGAAAAITLAQGGTRALVIERTRETGDALCGGFLSWRTLAAVERLGVDPDALGAAVVRRVRLFAAGRVVEAPLPAPARGVSRHRLDSLLLARAVAAGAAVERGVAARAIEERAVRTADGALLAGDALFLASGKHDVRGRTRPAPGADPALGLRTRRADTPALARLVGDAVELHLFRGGYAGVVRQEDGSTNICLALRRSRLSAAGTPARLLETLAAEAPALGERLGDMTDSAIEAVANVPYGWRARAGETGLFRLGDQAAVIPSLAGEGMGIALASGMSAAQAWRDGGAGAAASWQARFARRAGPPLAVAGAVRALAEHPVLAAPLLAPLARAGMLEWLARWTRIGGS
ncbi:FAD-dependent monooxygenase [Sphingomonas sp. BK580]|uniref:NAD(P)/FAD-dependent oxidoreductase n=1 Tax=Sphingomonas sp. BK580 TaxID=2586972 RepID=UPI00160B87C7|nr:FAD-dependent monooxygenase [Sphingomonas sp. BK580]MBB3693847.1 flavin-dependent dehydrogenase [Sphingomonas sp. BK580]